MENEMNYTIQAHTEYPTKPSKAFRKWDGKTPYWIHPVWAALTILTETTLDERTRQEGYYTLIYHDLIEDTTQKLPPDTPSRIEYLVQEMTFQGGSAQEMQEIWKKPGEIRLYKLYDKVSNLLDGTWMDREKRRGYEEYTKRLSENVIKNYGELNITKIARGIMK